MHVAAVGCNRYTVLVLDSRSGSEIGYTARGVRVRLESTNERTNTRSLATRCCIMRDLDLDLDPHQRRSSSRVLDPKTVSKEFMSSMSLCFGAVVVRVRVNYRCPGPLRGTHGFGDLHDRLALRLHTSRPRFALAVFCTRKHDIVSINRQSSRPSKQALRDLVSATQKQVRAGA